MSKIIVGETDALILCGGQGKRFREIRNDIPKSLAPIQNKVFLDLLLNDLILKGFKRIILATGYLSEQIEAHVLTRNDAEYLISRETNSLGTAGAIKFADSKLKSNPFIIMNGDSHIEYNMDDFLNFHLEKKADMSVLLSSQTNGKDYGHVELDEDKRIITFREKLDIDNSHLVNAGVYCMKPKLLFSINTKENISLEKEMLPEWTRIFDIYGMVVDNPVHDIGTLERYSELNKII